MFIRFILLIPVLTIFISCNQISKSEIPQVKVETENYVSTGGDVEIIELKSGNKASKRMRIRAGWHIMLIYRKPEGINVRLVQEP